MWLGFVNEADEQPASMLNTWVLPGLAAVGVAFLAMSGGKVEHAEEEPPPSSAAAARVPTTANEAAPPDVKPAPEPPAPVAEAPAAVPEPPEEASAPADDQAESQPEAPQPQAELEPPPPKPKREPKPLEPLSPAAARKAARAARGLRTALADGRAQASRASFAAVASDGDETSWTEAKAACAGLNLDGVSGWRLPSRGEAREIHRGKAAPRAAYWTRQRGPHDDTIYVYDPRTRRSAPWLDQEIASVVCVQPKPR